MVNFAGNDYLGLASHPAVVEALRRTALTHGISATSSRWALGWTDLHDRLERELASFMGLESACLIGAAYLGGAIYFGQLARQRGGQQGGHRVVFCDELAHSSQFLGMRAAGLDIHTFRHLDAADLRRQLKDHSNRAGNSANPPIIATDGVFGISGEIAPLADLAELARFADADLFVDDAHGIGVLGETSRGASELAGIMDFDRLTILGSLSKAFGAAGGFLAGRAEWVDRFRHSPEASGSTPLPAAIAAAALESLRIIRTDPTPRRRMEASAARIRRALDDHGIAVVDRRHPIIAMLLPDESEAAALARHFLSFNLRIPYFQYASEPRHNLLRAAARAIYTDEHVARFEEALGSRR
jgi:7-keto-8-aminopelargonate synthetase-like enzyme